MAQSAPKRAVSLIALLALLTGAAAAEALPASSAETQTSAASGQATLSPGGDAALANPAIDEVAYLRVAGEAIRHRASHRLSEADFIRMSKGPGTVVLDTRSAARFAELHVRGAINLSFPDLAVASLATTLPDKDVRILIYCNNNFRNAESAFPAKLVSASLNVPTYITLYDYGYRNVWELGPLIDIERTAIEFDGTPPPAPPAPR